MTQKIFSSLVLIIIGILLGLFILTSYQFHKRIQQTEQLILDNSQKITTIENFINQQLLGKDSAETDN